MTARDDREQLAARLVEAAAQAHEDANAAWRADRAGGPIRIARARSIAIAVLRELAARPDGYLRNQEDGGIAYTKTLRGLADYIEKGAGE